MDTPTLRGSSKTCALQSAPPQETHHAIHALGKPDGHRRLRVHRIRRAGPRCHGQAVREHGLYRHRETPSQERDAIPPGRNQLHHQRRAGFVRAALCAPARPVDLRDCVSRAGRRVCLQACAGAGRLGLRHPQRPDGAEHSGHQGHRRFADLPGGPLDRQERRQGRRYRQHQHLRRRFRAHRGRQSEPHRARPDLHRPPDAQRLPWPDERMGRVLRTLLQLP